MKSKIIDIKSKRTIEQNFISIGEQYLKEVDKKGLAIYGAKTSNEGVVLITKPEVTEAVLQVVNQINQQWSNSHGI